MKLSDLVKSSIEAGEYFRGCQAMPTFPDAPFAASEFFAGKNLVKIIPAKIAPFEETIFANDVDGQTTYKKLAALEFFYVLVVSNDNIEDAFVPDDIFATASEAEAFALLHQVDYAAIR